MPRYPVVLALPALLALAACGAPQDRYGAPGSAVEASQRAAAAAAADWSRAEAVTVTLDEFSFAPDALVFRAGRPYALTLVNVGSADHTFTAPAFFRAIALRRPAATATAGAQGAPLDSVAVAAGQRRTLEFVPVTQGTYPLRCERPLHAAFGMTGKITIE